MARSIFYGFGAFVGSITGPTTCAWWPDDPAVFNWDPAKQVTVDLGQNPEAARRGLIKITDIQADDYSGYTFGGQTQIGPMWPGGRMTGACYLESTYWNGLANPPDRLPPGVQGRTYELTSVLYWDGPLAGRRFIGVHAEIRQKQGNRGLVALWAPTASLVPGQPPFGSFWLDFQAHVHPLEKDLTEVGVGANDPQSGAAFIDSQTLTAMAAPGAKIPRYLGGYLLRGRT